MPDIDIYNPRFLAEALDQRLSPRRFFMKTFFHKAKFHTTATVDIDVRKGSRKVAAFVHPIHQGVVVERDGYDTNTVKPGYTKELLPLTPTDTITRAFGEDYQTPLTPAARAAFQLGEDMLNLDERVSRLEEKMAASALIRGKVHVLGKGLDHVVDFGYEQGKHLNVLSGSSCWDSAGGDPMKDIDRWSREINSRCGFKPNKIIVGQEALWAIIDSAKLQNRLNLLNFNMGQIGPSEALSAEDEEDGVTWHGRLSPSNIDIYTYDEQWLNIETGKEEPLVPPNGVFLGSTRAGCVMHYGMIQNMFALDPRARFPLSWMEKDGSARWLQMESAPLPNPYQVDAFMFNTVL